MNLVIFGHGKPVEMAIKALQCDEITILNVEQDKIRFGEEQELFVSFLNKYNIMLNSFYSLKEETDMIFVFNYNKIIDMSRITTKNVINLHMGLLPLYRGNSANAWAIMNGENEVGYTIHEVNENLDQGDIYYKFSSPYKEGETYIYAKTAINKDIEQNLAANLLDIYKNRLMPKSQDREEFIYNPVLRPSDGIIKNWNIKTDLLLKSNRNRIFKAIGYRIKIYNQRKNLYNRKMFKNYPF